MLFIQYIGNSSRAWCLLFYSTIIGNSESGVPKHDVDWTYLWLKFTNKVKYCNISVLVKIFTDGVKPRVPISNRTTYKSLYFRCDEFLRMSFPHLSKYLLTIIYIIWLEYIPKEMSKWNVITTGKDCTEIDSLPSCSSR